VTSNSEAQTQVQQVSQPKALIALFALTAGAVGIVAGIWLMNTHFLKALFLFVMMLVFSGSDGVLIETVLTLFLPWTFFMLLSAALLVWSWRRISFWRTAKMHLKISAVVLGVFSGAMGGVAMASTLHSYFLSLAK
jgi:hypothetical protein